MTAPRALVVDDHADWRLTFVELLANAGVEADAADGIPAARALLAANRYALLVLDMVLGEELVTLPTQLFLAFVRREYPDLPVVATTGQRVPYPDVFGLRDLGVVDFWPKQGMSVAEVYEKVGRIVARPSSLAERPADGTPRDAFISYSHDDRAWVHGVLVRDLEAAGLTVCIDDRDFVPGAYSVREMERAVRESRRTVVVLTPSYLDSEWTEFEMVLARTLDPAARTRRVVPVLRSACSVPPSIGALSHVDLTPGADADMQFRRLVGVLRAG